MAYPTGQFDVTTVKTASFDPTLQAIGWFDRSLVTNNVAATLLGALSTSSAGSIISSTKTQLIGAVTTAAFAPITPQLQLSQPGSLISSSFGLTAPKNTTGLLSLVIVSNVSGSTTLIPYGVASGAVAGLLGSFIPQVAVGALSQSIAGGVGSPVGGVFVTPSMTVSTSSFGSDAAALGLAVSSAFVMSSSGILVPQYSSNTSLASVQLNSFSSSLVLGVAPVLTGAQIIVASGLFGTGFSGALSATGVTISTATGMVYIPTETAYLLGASALVSAGIIIAKIIGRPISAKQMSVASLFVMDSTVYQLTHVSQVVNKTNNSRVLTAPNASVTFIPVLNSTQTNKIVNGEFVLTTLGSIYTQI